MENHLKEAVETEDLRPEWDNTHVPNCTEGCPSHDGKRCELLGHRPSDVCLPAIAIICVKANHALSIPDDQD